MILNLFDLYKDALGKDKNGNDIFLKDIWPSNKEIEETLTNYIEENIDDFDYQEVVEINENQYNIKLKKNK